MKIVKHTLKIRQDKDGILIYRPPNKEQPGQTSYFTKEELRQIIEAVKSE